MLLANVPVYLCCWRGGKFGLLYQGSSLSVGIISVVDRLCFLPTAKSQAVSMQTESSEHDHPVVLRGGSADVPSVSASDRKSGCEFAGEVKMKRRPIVYGVVAVVVAVAMLLVYYFYLGSSAPAGQQPLVRLDNSNVELLKQTFNESKNSVRVMVMLSPT